MKLNRTVLTAIATTALSFGIALSAVAQVASLTSNNPNARINIRSRPTTRSYSPHYGLPGDVVTVLRSTRGRDGYQWYYVRFPRSGAEGWVRGDLISLSR